MSTKEDLILVGIIASSHGIKGCVCIKSFTKPATNIIKMKVVNALKENTTLKLVSENAKGQLICQINNITSRNAADELRGSQLFCEATNLPDLEEDEFYIEKLKGLPVVDSNLKALGQITGIFNFGAGDIIEVKVLDSGKKELFPFNKQFFPVISENYVVLTVNN